MKKVILGLFLLAAPLGAQTLTSPPPASLGYCYYASGNEFLPIAAGSGGSIVLTNPPPATLVFGNYAAGPNYQPLQCDSGGNLIISGGSSALVVGTTPITSGTVGQTLYDNAGVLGSGGNAATANSADNLFGGGANDIPYQTAATTTAFIAPVNSAVVSTNGSGVPSESTALPSGITATTQTAGDATTKVATDAFVNTAISTTWYIAPIQGGSSVGFVNSPNRVTAYAFIPSQTVTFGNIYFVAHISDTGLAAVTGISGGSGFSGTGTLLLTAFNNGCTSSTATVNITSGAFTSATITAAGSGCTAPPTSATCTSGTATCTGSPVSITVATALDLYSGAIANSSGGLICHPTTGQNVPTANTLMTNTCSEGTVTLTAGTIYILLLTGDAIAGAVNGSTTQSMSGPYYNANTAGCSSANGVISGTCTISLAATEYGFGVPAFTLH